MRDPLRVLPWRRPPGRARPGAPARKISSACKRGQGRAGDRQWPAREPDAGFAETPQRPRRSRRLVALIYQPLPEMPRWGAGRDYGQPPWFSTRPGQPGHQPRNTMADPMNLFVVVESGDHHVTILDGDRFEPITRFAEPLRPARRPKFSPDGRFVYFGSRDGWVTKYDLYTLEVVAEMRAGINMRNIAVSADGKWVLAGRQLSAAQPGGPGRPGPVALPGHSGATTARASSRVSAVYNAPPRRSFIVALKDIKEIWELSYDPDAPPIYGGNSCTVTAQGEEEGWSRTRSPSACAGSSRRLPRRLLLRPVLPHGDRRGARRWKRPGLPPRRSAGEIAELALLRPAASRLRHRLAT